MISSVVTKASKSKVAPAALLELKGACDLFEKAASYGGRAVKFLVCNHSLRRTRTDSPHSPAYSPPLTSESAEDLLRDIQWNSDIHPQ